MRVHCFTSGARVSSTSTSELARHRRRSPAPCAIAEDDEVEELHRLLRRLLVVAEHRDPADDDVAARASAGSRASALTRTRSPAGSERALRPPSSCRSSSKTWTPSALLTCRPKPGLVRSRRRLDHRVRSRIGCSASTLVIRSPFSSSSQASATRAGSRGTIATCRSPSPVDRPLLEVQPQVLPADLLRVADEADLAVVDQHRPVAVRARPSAMSWVTRTIVLPPSFMSAEDVRALLLEGGVADGQHLVDQQDVGVGLDHHREGEADQHPRGVVLQLQVDELLELGELEHRVQPVAAPPSATDPSSPR